MKIKNRGKKVFLFHEPLHANGIGIYDRVDRVADDGGYRELSNAIVALTFNDYQDEIKLGNKMLKDKYYESAEKSFNNAHVIRKFILTEYFDTLCGNLNCDALLQEIDYSLINSGLTILMPHHLKSENTH